MRLRFPAILIIGLLFGAVLVSANTSAVSKNDTKTISNNLSAIQILPEVINGIKSPDLKNPDWLQSEIGSELAAIAAAAAAKLAAKVTPVSSSVVTYDVSNRGTITADLLEFKSIANQTLNDSRGWSRLGVSFQEVTSGGSFTLVLSEASRVPDFSSMCSIDWSCRVGHYIIINQDRWLNASDSWNQSGGSLIDYRHMVITHEVGHWLGHIDDNSHCGGSGQPAPVMQEQSMNLLGCSFNPWPLNSEIWSSTLGI